MAILISMKSAMMATSSTQIPAPTVAVQLSVEMQLYGQETRSAMMVISGTVMDVRMTAHRKYAAMVGKKLSKNAMMVICRTGMVVLHSVDWRVVVTVVSMHTKNAMMVTLKMEMHAPIVVRLLSVEIPICA
jgi:hypothetical protein